jgi:hypothetical protein
MDKELEDFTENINAIRMQDLGDDNEYKKKLRFWFKKDNYFVFKGHILVIKISRIKKPFYGVGKEFIDFFNTGKLDYFLVLLTSNHSGWIYSKNEVNGKIKNNEWRLRPQDNNYKINYGKLDDKDYFYFCKEFESKVSI